MCIVKRNVHKKLARTFGMEDYYVVLVQPVHISLFYMKKTFKRNKQDSKIYISSVIDEDDKSKRPAKSTIFLNSRYKSFKA